MRLTEQTLSRCGLAAASVCFLIFAFMPLLMHAQGIVVRDLCALVAERPQTNRNNIFRVEPEPTEAAVLEGAKQGDLTSESGNRKNAKLGDNQPAALDKAKADVLCVHASPMGVRYNPQIAAKVRRQYEKSLVHAHGLKNQNVISKVDLNVRVDITTPPGFFYRDGKSVTGGPYETMGQCSQSKRRTGNIGICGPKEGPIFISLTGSITNNNRFPLSSVSIQCEYRDRQAMPRTIAQHLPYTLAPEGGHFPLQDDIIGQLPPHSEINDISCQVVAADIWKNTDGIEYLNAPLNP
jgi:hypothetical protein